MIFHRGLFEGVEVDDAFRFLSNPLVLAHIDEAARAGNLAAVDMMAFITTDLRRELERQVAERGVIDLTLSATDGEALQVCWIAAPHKLRSFAPTEVNTVIGGLGKLHLAHRRHKDLNG